jgi:hypothetical protein
MKNMVQKFRGCTRHFCTLQRPHQKISHDLEMVVLHVYQTNQFLSRSDMDKSKRAMSFEHMHDKLSRNRFKFFYKHK